MINSSEKESFQLESAEKSRFLTEEYRLTLEIRLLTPHAILDS
jgi:hypothetical protein